MCSGPVARCRDGSGQRARRHTCIPFTPVSSSFSSSIIGYTCPFALQGDAFASMRAALLTPLSQGRPQCAAFWRLTPTVTPSAPHRRARCPCVCAGSDAGVVGRRVFPCTPARGAWRTETNGMQARPVRDDGHEETKKGPLHSQGLCGDAEEHRQVRADDRCRCSRLHAVAQRWRRCHRKSRLCRRPARYQGHSQKFSL